MCGRFALKTLGAVFEEFAVPFTQLDLSFNIAPTDPVAAIRQTDESGPPVRHVARLHWGLIPS